MTKSLSFQETDEEAIGGEQKKGQSNQSHHSAHHLGQNFSERASVSPKDSSVFLPWSKGYRVWWVCTVILAFITILFESYEIAFVPAGLVQSNPSTIFLYVVSALFVVDILVNFNLAYEEYDEVVRDRVKIAKRYARGRLALDIIGVFPFYPILLAITGSVGEDTAATQFMALVRLFTIARIHRIFTFFNTLQYNTRVSLMTLTLVRNFLASLTWTHLAACIMFFTSRHYDFGEDTWIGGSLEGLSSHELYITALYWSVVTFTTVGYGDFSPVNAAEQVIGMIYMLINIVIQAWIIGSITLLVVKNDENTGEYRGALAVLDQYSEINEFDKKFHHDLRTQLKLDFGNREIADENVLGNFPLAVRRKVLRKLYLPYLRSTNLMENVREQFVDAFLTTCTVEIFRPSEEILQRGSISTDLYLLVGGEVALLPTESPGLDQSERGSLGEVVESGNGKRILCAGDFINEVGFFTESPQIETCRTLTVVKTLTISRSAYRLLAEDHPGSVGRILQNLLRKVESMVVDLPTRMEILKAGSVYLGSNSIRDDTSTSIHPEAVTEAALQSETALTHVKDLVKMHINKQKDDHTTRFLFAASRGDTKTILLMCDQGFDPNNADYDSRTALMVSSMTGNTEVVSALLEYGANTSLADMHGHTALYEAAKNGHASTMKILLDNGASLCMDENLAASTLCQAVFDSDIQRLRRLLEAGIQVNAADYDKRTASHIASSEGNLAALRVLVEFGADLTLKDRWNNTANDEKQSTTK